MYSIFTGGSERTVIQATKHRSWDHALRPHRLRVERYRTYSANGPQGSQTTKQSARSQRHLLGAADRRPVARSARALWALHKRIQPLQSLAQGGHLGPPDGRRRQGVRWHQMIDSSIVRVHQHASGAKKRVEIVAWAEAGVASPRKSMRGSTPKAARSAC